MTLYNSFSNVIRDFIPLINSTSFLFLDVATELVTMTGLSTPDDRAAALQFVANTAASVPGMLYNYSTRFDFNQYNCSI